MIKDFNISSLENRLSAIRENLKKIKNSIGIEKSTIDNFAKEELPLIVLSSGDNISKPFYKKNEYSKKFREYNVPSNFITGVYTGETYYALSNMTNTKNITIIKKIDRDSLEYGYKSDSPRNFNIGITSAFIESETKIYRDKITNIINKIL